MSKYDDVTEDKGFRISGSQKERRKRPSRRGKMEEEEEGEDSEHGKAGAGGVGDKTEETEETKKRRREEIAEKLRKDKNQSSKRQALAGFTVESAKLVSDTKTQEEVSEEMTT